MLTDGFWRRQFGGDPRIVGKTLTLAGEPYTVAGVMPASFRFPEQGAIDGLVPLQLNAQSELQRKAMRILHVAGRLKPGVTLEQARANLGILMADVRRRQPKFYGSDVKLVAIPLREHEVAQVRLVLLVLLASVGCVLLIACANVANLLLARAAGREREIALRAALGAGRWRLARQLLTESVLLGIAGGAAGIVLVAAAIRTLVHLAPADIPRISDAGVDLRVLGFALAMSLVTGVVFGLAPAFAAGRTDLNEALKAGGGRGTGDGSHAWLRRTLVVSELALSLVLLAGAGLLVESLWRLENTPLGFRAEHILTVALPLHGTPYEKGPRHAELVRELTDQFRRLPGVTAVGLTNALPPNET
ncbi:MAG: FtsX-like permease family protein, partial [Bryobacteraceae bacterium]